jgi:dimethylglycine catabolism A
MGTEPVCNASLLMGFDHVVIATGARYRLRLGRIVEGVLRARLARTKPLRWLASSNAARDYFYHRLRRATGVEVQRCIGPGASVDIIGDAGSAGKTGQAILSAYEAAFE